MFDFVIAKDGTSVFERHCVRGEVVIAALHLLLKGETLTISFSDNSKEKNDD